MKATELRDMTTEQLNTKLGELKEELFNLRFQLAVNQLDNPRFQGLPSLQTCT